MKGWRRLRHTSPEEMRFRARVAVETARESVRFALSREGWDRKDLLSRLTPASRALIASRDALARGDWPRADAALRAHFTARTQRFVIVPADRTLLAAGIHARYRVATAEAARRGEAILQGRFDLLAHRNLSFRTSRAEIDWHFDPVNARTAPNRFWRRVPYLDPESGDHKIIWELNRHQHWLTLGRAAWLTGDERYANAFADQLESWLRANPPLSGINWSSMLELAFRCISWIWALHFFSAEGDSERGSIVDLLLGLDRQLDHISRHLSVYFSPNTHLLGEALALYVAGRALPELGAAARWERIGRRVLTEQARAQVHPDGGHAELSAHYHRYALDFYLLALAVARITRDPAADLFARVSSRLAFFCRAIADGAGRLPTIGDDDGGMLFPICGRAPADASDSLALAANLLDRPDLAVGDPPEEVAWMLGRVPPDLADRRPPLPPTSTLFADTGYAVLRSSEGMAIVDVGPHGFLNGGHAHADALSLVVVVHDRPLLIDPGTFTYTMDPAARDRFRSTAMHNTVVVDGRSQSVPSGPFHWASRAHSHLDQWRRTSGFDFVEASHDGYQPIVHRRAVLRDTEGLWIVADHILGTGQHLADTYWHFDPAWSLAARDGGLTVTHRNGLHAALASAAAQCEEFRGDPTGLGWCAPVYGRAVPSLTARMSHQGTAPFSMVTAIATVTARVPLGVETVLVEASDGNDWQRTGAAITRGDAVALALFATVVPGGHANRRGPQRIDHPSGALTTDARAAVLHLSPDGQPRALSLIEARYATWTGRGAFELGPLAEAQDLHLGMAALTRLSRSVEARPAG
jgi:hypothetical protein